MSYKHAMLFQASGEAEYVSTMADQPDQLYIQFVLSTIGNATIANMDASEALVRVIMQIISDGASIIVFLG